ncbi:pirin family protein [Flavobacteriales bacterium]|nr:pirin family protein [Flavobacteriales bacterium]
MPNKENKTKNAVIHKANSRNSADFGWLKVNHTFSFANYYNPDRMNFGALRVLNDDTILGGKGFSTHPHDNMEIITIPLEGSLKHKDDMGNGSVIKKGDIQVMSAGKGIQHSEYNGDDILPAKVLQIWLHPNKINVIPRYQQLSIKSLIKPNIFSQILSPDIKDQGVWIHQNSWFSLGEFTKNTTSNYKLHSISNGIYIFIIDGKVEINGDILNKRDAIGLWQVDSINISSSIGSRVLIMEVPMNV